MSGNYPLDELTLNEQCEELLFKFAISDYAAEENRKLNEDIKTLKEHRSTKDFRRFISKTVRQRQAADAWYLFVSVGGKVITKVAVAFLCVMIAFGSTMVISADAREAVFKLLATETERYTQIEMNAGQAEAFIDPEVYQMEGAYAPTYMPEGYALDSDNILGGDGISLTVSYYRGDSWIRISQTANETAMPTIDTENAEHTETIIIGDSEALFTIKTYESGDRITQIIWQNRNALLHVYTNADEEEAVLVAKGLKKLP